MTTHLKLKTIILKLSVLTLLLAFLVTGFLINSAKSKRQSSNSSNLSVISVPKEPVTGAETSIENIIIGDIKTPAFGSVMIFSVTPARIDNDCINRLKNKLGIDSEGIATADTTTYTGNNGANIIILNSTGTLSCTTDKNEMGEDAPLNNLQENDYYLSKARAWIIESGLFSEEYSKKCRVNPNGFIQDGNDNSISRPSIMVAEFFHNDLNSIPISGVAPRIVVQMNADGDILSVLKIQNSYTPFKEYPIIKIDKAIEKIRSGNSLIYGISGNVDSVTIKSCQLIYYNRESNIRQNYLLPYYLFEATNNDGNENISIAVRAIDDIYLNDK